MSNSKSEPVLPNLQNDEDRDKINLEAQNKDVNEKNQAESKLLQLKIDLVKSIAKKAEEIKNKRELAESQHERLTGYSVIANKGDSPMQIHESDASKKARKNLKRTQVSGSQKFNNEKIYGSCYHYEIQLDRRSDKITLVQVRTSARFKKRSQGKKQSISRRKSSQRKSVRKSIVDSKRKSIKKDEESDSSSGSDDDENYKESEDESEISVNWVKEHLPELSFKNVFLEHNYAALTQEDDKVAKMLRNFYEEGEKQSQQSSQQKSSEQEYSESLEISEAIGFGHEEQQETKQEKKKPKKIPMFLKEDRPLIISEVIDPNLNDHGIYALLRLGKWSILDFGARYAVTPISKSSFMKKKHILEDLQLARKLTGAEKGELAFIQMNSDIMEMIEKVQNQKK